MRINENGKIRSQERRGEGRNNKQYLGSLPTAANKIRRSGGRRLAASKSGQTALNLGHISGTVSQCAFGGIPRHVSIAQAGLLKD